MWARSHRESLLGTKWRLWTLNSGNPRSRPVTERRRERKLQRFAAAETGFEFGVNTQLLDINFAESSIVLGAQLLADDAGQNMSLQDFER